MVRFMTYLVIPSPTTKYTTPCFFPHPGSFIFSILEIEGYFLLPLRVHIFRFSIVLVFVFLSKSLSKGFWTPMRAGCPGRLAVLLSLEMRDLFTLFFFKGLSRRVLRPDDFASHPPSVSALPHRSMPPVPLRRFSMVVWSEVLREGEPFVGPQVRSGDPFLLFLAG